MTDYAQKALIYAEQHGIIEYDVNGSIMEYMIFYGPAEGWVYVAVELDREEPMEIVRETAFGWHGWIPYWLMKASNGGLRYNYMEG